MPIKVYRFSWPSAQLLGELVRILGEEMLGYHVSHQSSALYPDDFETRNAYLSTMGCAEPWDWGQGGVPPCIPAPLEQAVAHAALEFWTSYSSETQVWYAMQPDRWPLDLGSVGYAGDEGVYLREADVNKFMANSGVDMSWYTYYKDVWYSPRLDFLNRSSLPKPLSCDEVRAIVPVISAEEAEGLQCNDGWWAWDLCAKGDPPLSRCVPLVFTVAVPSVACFRLWKSHNLAGMMGFWNYTDYTEVVRTYNVPFYGYMPDATFAELRPVRVRFPEHDDDDWKKTWPVTDTGQVELKKLAMRGLYAVAPMMHKFLENFKVSYHQMMDMLVDYNTDFNVTRTACAWLADPNHSATWSASWLPDPSDCVLGQGVSPSDAGCEFCVPGTFSRRADSDRKLHCEACPAGSFQADPGSSACEACPAGQVASAAKSSKCVACAAGFYSGPGSHICIPCAAGLTTRLSGSESSADCVCAVGSYAANASQGCRGCPLGQTTLGPGATDEDGCVLDRWAVACIGGVAAVVALAVSLSLIAHWILRRRLAKFVALKDKLLEERLQRGLSSVSELGHPMVCISAHNLRNMSEDELYSLHEGVRDTGKLLVLDTIDSVLAFKASGVTLVLFSYQWLSWKRPGPDEQQLAAIRQGLHNLCGHKRVGLHQIYGWLDILSIPQFHPGLKALAVNSLYIYASLVDALVVLAPPSQHIDTGAPAGLESYRSRAWCRAEQFAHICHNGAGSIYLQCSSDGDFEKVPADWFDRICHIFDGDMTCCRTKHADGGRCDREALVPALLGLYFAVYTQHRAAASGGPSDPTSQVVAELICSRQVSIFPETYTYITEGGAEVRELFGDMIQRIENQVDADVKGARRRSGTFLVRSAIVPQVKVSLASPYDRIMSDVLGNNRKEEEGNRYNGMPEPMPVLGSHLVVTL